MRILIADDEQAAQFGMKKALARDGWELLLAADGEKTLEMIRVHRPHLVFLDLAMPKVDGRGVLRELRGIPMDCEIIVVTANDSVDAALECIRLGAADYVTKPFEVARLRAIARRSERRVLLERRVARLEGELDGRRAFGALVGVSPAMRSLFARLERVAAAPLDVLVRGETGTGKELIAREIHRRSRRAEGPFVAVNTASIAESLAESELFGHRRGAFTGAERDHQGCFERASGGTLFLDEIGDMPLGTQAKILRALQEREVLPVGAGAPVAVDVRVISATHQDLTSAVSDGLFRDDLYYRVRGVELEVPPLRQRREDVVVLADYFLERLAPPDRPARTLSPEARDRLLTHAWPGNVRELEQVIAASHALAAKDVITAAELELDGASGARDFELDDELDGLPLTEAKTRLVERFERRSIERALEVAEGNVSAAARRLGIHRQSLQQKMAQLGIERP